MGAVLDMVLEYTRNIIVVNDGSDDQTDDILKKYTGISILTHSENKGKGMALRMAFKHAIHSGYKYGITIDSDGQHFVKDLDVFIDKLSTSPGSIMMGSRNMKQESIPGTSNFGNRFSNFWFLVETGISLPDTQSGFRLYPLHLMKDMKFYTARFEFEIEVLVRSAWKNIEIIPLPVSVYYALGKERVSHFRPFTDFMRISVLNALLVIISIFYIWPRKFLAGLTGKKNLRERLREQLFAPNETIGLKSFSVAFGIFMGIVPIWGFQLIGAIFIAIILKLNKPLVIIAANISIPPMIPLIIYLSYKAGAYGMGRNTAQLEFSRNITIESIRDNFTQYVYGSFLLATASAIIAGLLCWIFLKIYKTKFSLK